MKPTRIDGLDYAVPIKRIFLRNRPPFPWLPLAFALMLCAFVVALVVHAGSCR